MITATANLGSTITATAELKSVQVGSCLDATVHNSNNSYSTTVASGGDLPLPNIDFTDSTGVTTSVPSMEDIVATPIPPCADATVTVNSTPYGTAPSGGSENVEVVSGVMGTTPRGSLISGKWFISDSPFQINGVNRDSLPPETTFNLTVRLNGVEDSGSYNSATDTLDITSSCPDPSVSVSVDDSTPSYEQAITITATPTDITPTSYTFEADNGVKFVHIATQAGASVNWTVQLAGIVTIRVTATDGVSVVVGTTTIDLDRFIFRIKTNNSGSAFNRFVLPLINTGTINAIFDWGDGSSSAITAYNDADITHTYATDGEYVIEATGQIQGWQFNNGGDKLKMLELIHWGTFNMNVERSFFGCLYMTGDPIDSPIVSSTSLNFSFYQCSVFNPRLIGMDVSSVTTFIQMFYLSSFDRSIDDWNMGSATNITGMFQNTPMSHPFPDTLPISGLTAIQDCFRDCLRFDADLTNVPLLDVAAVALGLPPYISSTTYSNFLIGANAQGVGLDPHSLAVFAKYNAGAAAARANLIATYGWTISDGGAL